MTAGHLVSHADFALLGNVYLGYLHDAGGQVIAYGEVKFTTAQLGIQFLGLAQVVDDGATN